MNSCFFTPTFEDVGNERNEVYELEKAEENIYPFYESDSRNLIGYATDLIIRIEVFEDE